MNLPNYTIPPFHRYATSLIIIAMHAVITNVLVLLKIVEDARDFTVEYKISFMDSFERMIKDTNLSIKPLSCR